MEETKYLIEDGVPTAGAGEPAEVQQTSTALARDLKRIDTKVDLLLKALGVSVVNLEEEANEAN